MTEKKELKGTDIFLLEKRHSWRVLAFSAYPYAVGVDIKDRLPKTILLTIESIDRSIIVPKSYQSQPILFTFPVLVNCSSKLARATNIGLPNSS